MAPFLALLLTFAHAAATCSPEQYLSKEEGKCCKRCPPGSELIERCRGGEETKCRDCPSNYFSEKYNYDMCTKCSFCDEKSGSHTVKKCTKISNTVCKCADGTTPYNNENTACRCPKGNQLVSKESCIPCPEGSFSSKDNGKCQPWTNCTALGGVILTPGTRTMDTACKWEAGTTTFTLIPSTNKFTGFTSARNVTLGKQNISLSTSSLNPRVSNHWGSSFLFIMGLILLGISGTITLLMTFQSCKKKKRPVLLGLQAGRKSCRIPVQEEHTNSDSSLTTV